MDRKLGVEGRKQCHAVGRGVVEAWSHLFVVELAEGPRGPRLGCFPALMVAMQALCGATPLLAAAVEPPIHFAPVKPDGVEPVFQCGMFKWSTDFPWMSGGGTACWEAFDGAPCTSQFKRANLNLNCDTGPCEAVVEAIFHLSNEGGEYWTAQTGMPDPTLDPISATAHRTGWLFYDPPPAPLLAQTQRLKLRSVGMVSLSIELHREGSVAGWSDASATGAGSASIKTVGEGFGVREEHSIAEALADAEENHAKAWQPGVSWTTQMVSTQLGLGFSFGTENGGHANVGWSSGGNLVTQEISELMVCSGWDCVGGDEPWNKVFAQDAAVSAKAKLIDGRYARVHAKSTFKEFEMAALIGPMASVFRVSLETATKIQSSSRLSRKGGAVQTDSWSIRHDPR